MMTNLKKIALSIFIITTFICVKTVNSNAASPYDMITEDGQVIPTDKKI